MNDNIDKDVEGLVSRFRDEVGLVGVTGIRIASIWRILADDCGDVVAGFKEDEWKRRVWKGVVDLYGDVIMVRTLPNQELVLINDHSIKSASELDEYFLVGTEALQCLVFGVESRMAVGDDTDFAVLEAIGSSRFDGVSLDQLAKEFFQLTEDNLAKVVTNLVELGLITRKSKGDPRSQLVLHRFLSRQSTEDESEDKGTRNSFLELLAKCEDCLSKIKALFDEDTTVTDDILGLVGTPYDLDKAAFLSFVANGYASKEHRIELVHRYVRKVSMPISPSKCFKAESILSLVPCFKLHQDLYDNCFKRETLVKKAIFKCTKHDRLEYPRNAKTFQQTQRFFKSCIDQGIDILDLHFGLGCSFETLVQLFPSDHPPSTSRRTEDPIDLSELYAANDLLSTGKQLEEKLEPKVCESENKKLRAEICKFVANSSAGFIPLYEICMKLKDIREYCECDIQNQDIVEAIESADNSSLHIIRCPEVCGEYFVADSRKLTTRRQLINMVNTSLASKKQTRSSSSNLERLHPLRITSTANFEILSRQAKEGVMPSAKFYWGDSSDDHSSNEEKSDEDYVVSGRKNRKHVLRHADRSPKKMARISGSCTSKRMSDSKYGITDSDASDDSGSSSQSDESEACYNNENDLLRQQVGSRFPESVSRNKASVLTGKQIDEIKRYIRIKSSRNCGKISTNANPPNVEASVGGLCDRLFSADLACTRKCYSVLAWALRNQCMLALIHLSQGGEDISHLNPTWEKAATKDIADITAELLHMKLIFGTEADLKDLSGKKLKNILTDMNSGRLKKTIRRICSKKNQQLRTVDAGSLEFSASEFREQGISRNSDFGGISLPITGMDLIKLMPQVVAGMARIYTLYIEDSTLHMKISSKRTASKAEFQQSLKELSKHEAICRWTIEHTESNSGIIETLKPQKKLETTALIEAIENAGCNGMPQDEIDENVLQELVESGSYITVPCFDHKRLVHAKHMTPWISISKPKPLILRRWMQPDGSEDPDLKTSLCRSLLVAVFERPGSTATMLANSLSWLLDPVDVQDLLEGMPGRVKKECVGNHVIYTPVVGNVNKHYLAVE